MKGRVPKITFIGAGSTVFAKNILGDILHRPAFKQAHIALMDLDKERLNESEIVINKVASTLNTNPKVTCHSVQREALDGADFVVVAFQIGGYNPCTIIDFDIPKKYGIDQTIADTLGLGGIMRGLRTVPHLWNICEDMRQVCPKALLLNYVNPMAINTWSIFEKYPDIQNIGLCHSVQGTANELAFDLGIPESQMRYRAAGINHMAFYLNLQQETPDGELIDLYPLLQQGYAEGRFPKEIFEKDGTLSRCQNLTRYEMLKRLGYFVTESSEHFAEYTPWFIKPNRPDLIKKFKIPLDEYPKRCIEQIDRWQSEAKEFKEATHIKVEESQEYASQIINSVWTGVPSVVYGNVKNSGLITNLPNGCAVEVPCLVDSQGVQPTYIENLPTHLSALIQTNINVQSLVVDALINERRESIYHAAMLDPRTAMILDLDQIWSLTDELLKAHKDYLPEWLQS